MIVPSAVSTPIFRNMPFLQLLQSRLKFSNEIALLLLCLLTIFILIVTQGLKMSQLRMVFLPNRKNYNLHIQ